MIQLAENELKQSWSSIQRMFAVIVFDPGGQVLDANPIFLEAMGYA